MKEIELTEITPGHYGQATAAKPDRFGAFCYHATVITCLASLSYVIDKWLGH